MLTVFQILTLKCWKCRVKLAVNIENQVIQQPCHELNGSDEQLYLLIDLLSQSGLFYSREYRCPCFSIACFKENLGPVEVWRWGKGNFVMWNWKDCTLRISEKKKNKVAASSTVYRLSEQQLAQCVQFWTYGTLLYIDVLPQSGASLGLA